MRILQKSWQYIRNWLKVVWSRVEMDDTEQMLQMELRDLDNFANRLS